MRGSVRVRDRVGVGFRVSVNVRVSVSAVMRVAERLEEGSSCTTTTSKETLR